GTVTYLQKVGNTAEFKIEGNAFTLWYTKYTNLGKLAVYVDDGATSVATINQYGSSRAWQVAWMSGNLGSGTHKVVLKHVGPSGKYVSIDAIQVSDILGTGTYDDRDPNLVTIRPFSVVSATGPYEGTYSQTKKVGDTATFWFNGSQLTLVYGKYTNMGNLGVYIDDVKVTTLNQKGARAWQVSWASQDLGPGDHKVVLKHAGPSGTYVNLDAVQVGTYPYPPSSGTGKYDDDDANWVYTGTLQAVTKSGPYDEDYTLLKKTGNSAEFWFTGSQITLWYMKYIDQGKMAVYIDYGKTPIVTLNQYGASRVWQAHWTSGDLGAGAHKVKLVNMGPSGKYINIDAIQIGDVPGSETYDDSDYHLNYAGSFGAKSGISGPHDGTYRQTSGVGSSVEFTFSGSQVLFWYGKSKTMGSVAVYIDGVQVGTINQYGTTTVWNVSWASKDLGAGVHTIKLKNLGPSGKYMNLDALQVRTYQDPPSMPAAKYDDTDVNWIYNTTFTSKTASGPYLGTWSYTNKVGNTAEFWFTGAQIELTYSKYSDQTKLAVYIDDELTPVVTLEQKGTSRVWQVTWRSGDLGAGPHKVILKHVGTSGKYVNIDAIEVFTTYSP
ncbi:MAG: hypothetical protein QUS33_10895, partial [Dehalococcoidia bacterium]|nr:hypothetical protein [Dehalococcoidia bacterium]